MSQIKLSPNAIGTGVFSIESPATNTNRVLSLPDNTGTILTSGATVTVSQGGTGQSTLTANNVILGNGTSAVNFVAPGTNGNVLQSNGTTWVSAGISVTPTAVSDQTNTSTGYFDLPAGTTAERPAVPATGMIRYNTTLGFCEQYTSTGWIGIAPPPTISTVSPTAYNGEQGTSFTITGTYFDPGSTVQFITATAQTFNAATTTVVSNTQITATTPQDFTVAQGPLTVRVTAGTGFTATATNAISTGAVPTWVTASGSIGTVNFGSSVNLSVSATDADAGATITYSLTSGSLPPGTSLNTANGAITGTAPSPTNNTTYTFSINATDNAGNSAGARSFSITVIGTNYVIEYIVVAGGGGGGGTGGGGGAGGYRSSVVGESSGGGSGAEATITASVGQSFGVTVGGGGSGATYPNLGSQGSNSVFGSITSTGGGGGAHGPQANPTSGGSGGGAGYGGSGASGTAGQGYRGGNAISEAPWYNGGGGGGAGAQGGDYGGGSTPPNGGVGVSSNITGSGVFRAGGGGAGSRGGGTSSGGNGGGGGGSNGGSGTSGTANTGGGGGSMGGTGGGQAGNGGSGVVIIRYSGSQRGSGGTVTSAGGYTIHTFTSSGTYTA